MALANDPVACTGNRHLGKLEDGMIGSGKLTVRREARDVSILEVARYNSAQTIKLSLARGMRLHPMGGQ